MESVSFFTGVGDEQRCLGTVIADRQKPPFRGSSLRRRGIYERWNNDGMTQAIVNSRHPTPRAGRAGPGPAARTEGP
jgi:hypothetical protein